MHVGLIGAVHPEIHRNATDSAEPNVPSTQQIVFITKRSEVVQVATATFMTHYWSSEIQVYEHFVALF